MIVIYQTIQPLVVIPLYSLLLLAVVPLYSLLLLVLALRTQTSSKLLILDPIYYTIANIFKGLFLSLLLALVVLLILV
jgi:hypothetical protein